MAEPRKIVLILGNGFDLDLGLKTSYKDFWESEFCPKDYPAPLIHHLNQRWPDNLDAVKWYDLENELLNYYKGLHNLKDGEDILTEDFIAAHGRPDIIITDPPRAGMHQDVVDVILKAQPEVIVYVSCNPATQARDLELLGSDYRITDIQPVDMFPHTPHVENVVRLVRKNQG